MELLSFLSAACAAFSAARFGALVARPAEDRCTVVVHAQKERRSRVTKTMASAYCKNQSHLIC